MIRLLFVLLLAPPELRDVQISWDDTLNPPGTTYSVKKSTGKCSESTGFSDIAVNLTQRSYVDQGVSQGQYCYTVSATGGPNAPPISVKVDKK